MFTEPPSVYRDDIGNPSGSNVVGKIPSACPVCESSSVTTTARTPDENTYWRCGRCGEVWNASRRQAGRARMNSRR